MRKRTKVVLGLAVAMVFGLAVQPALATRSSAGPATALTSSGTTAVATATATPTSPTSTSPTSTTATPTSPTTSATPSPTAVGVGSKDLVVGLGDSLTYRPASWFRLICGSGTLGSCVNAGITGNTTQQMYRRLQSQVLALDPDAMVLMGGANDIRHGATTKQIIGRLTRIVTVAQAAGVPVVISTVPPQDLHAAAVLALNRAIRVYAATAGLPLLDMYSSVGTAKGTYRSGLSNDGLHPNTKGFARMARVAEAKLPGLMATAEVA